MGGERWCTFLRCVIALILAVACACLFFWIGKEVVVGKLAKPPPGGWQQVKPYPLSYVPRFPVVYPFSSGEQGGLFGGGGSPEARPYTREQFERDGAGQIVTLALEERRNVAGHSNCLLYLNYFDRRAADYVVIRYTVFLGECPAGTFFGRYEVVETEATHPTLEGTTLIVPFTYVADGLLLALADIGGALVMGLLVYFGLLRWLG